MSGRGEVATANLVTFVRALRAEGFSVTTATVSELVAAASILGLHSGRDVREGFRSIVVTRQSQVEPFDEIFDRFFTGETIVALDSVVERAARRQNTERVARIGIGASESDLDAADAEEMVDVVGASEAERLIDVDFADLTRDEYEQVKQILAAMTWSPSTVRSRRRAPAHRGPTPDLRRTLRNMTGPNGDLVPLAFTRRRPRQRPLVVVADISGSMEQYSEMLLHFIHGAQHRFRRVESFVFATELTRITRQLRRRSASDALDQVARSVHDWSGGTRIGDAIGTYNRAWSRRVGGSRPMVLVISDGWDTGDPSLLSFEMRRLARNAHRIIWLNPLAGHDGYAPVARGMAAALPHVDDLLAAGTARSLIDLIDLLQSGTGTRTGVAS